MNHCSEIYDRVLELLYVFSAQTSCLLELMSGLSPLLAEAGPHQLTASIVLVLRHEENMFILFKERRRSKQ